MKLVWCPFRREEVTQEDVENVAYRGWVRVRDEHRVLHVTSEYATTARRH